MRVENQIQSLEKEIEALKVSFSQAAGTMSLNTASDTITTTKNTYYISNPGFFNPLEWVRLTELLEQGGSIDSGPYIGYELIQVTYAADNGSNVLASLEFEDLTPDGATISQIRRVKYNGGARWVIVCYPNVELVSGLGEYTWSPTSLKIVVRAIMPGTLEVVQL